MKQLDECVIFRLVLVDIRWV